MASKKVAAFVLLMGLYGAAVPTRCFAQATADKREYRDAIDEGLREFEARNFPEAREQFRRAHALMPSARTLRAVGMVEFELREYVECVSQLTAALASQVRPLSGALRQETRELLERAETYVGRLYVHPQPQDAHISIDGQETPEVARAPQWLSVGDHVIELWADSYSPQTRRVRISGQAQTDLRVALVPLRPKAEGEGLPAAAASPGGRDDDRRDKRRRRALWITAGIVALAAGASVAAVTLASPDGSNDSAKPLTTSHTPQDASLTSLRWGGL